MAHILYKTYAIDIFHVDLCIFHPDLQEIWAVKIDVKPFSILDNVVYLTLLALMDF
jgi:hypothetical protein